MSGCKWVFKTKHDPIGNIEQHKPRFVHQRFFTKKYGIGYKKTSSPCLKERLIKNYHGTGGSI